MKEIPFILYFIWIILKSPYKLFFHTYEKGGCLAEGFAQLAEIIIGSVMTIVYLIIAIILFVHYVL